MFYEVLLLVGGNEDYDSVPVVHVVGLGGAAFSFNQQARLVNAVGLGESIVNSLSTFLLEGLVVGACAGVFVGVALDENLH